MSHIKSLIITTILLFLIFPGFTDSDGDHHEEDELSLLNEDGSLSLAHIHGIEFYEGTPLVATHFGLIVYHEGDWEQIDSPEHDYMGFSLTEKGFYASGHPDPMTSLPNPLGIVFSNDLGKTFVPVAYYGELDFHWLSAGYNTDFLYAYTSDSTITTPAGFYYSQDKGRTWQKPGLLGVGGKLITFKAHPQIDGAIFISTTTGIFLSLDKGNNFFQMPGEMEGGALTITTDGKFLFSGSKKLRQLELSNKKLSSIPLPELDGDEILTHVAVSSVDIRKILIN
ncbi:MAG: hypothetical protein PF518_14505 [Spirochaetaceae bacterium]|jgi:hypothetical protein|nr:hypothetical protein [Spirochaetaceae bacterium]